jgi:hypothetical protein
MMWLLFEWRCRIQRLKMFWARSEAVVPNKQVEASRLTQLLSILNFTRSHIS